MLMIPTTTTDRNRAGRLAVAIVLDDLDGGRSVADELRTPEALGGAVFALAVLAARLLDDLPFEYVTQIRRELAADALTALQPRETTA